MNNHDINFNIFDVEKIKLKYAEIERKLKKAGCYVIRHGSNHSIWYSPITNRRFPVSNHKSEEAKSGTVKSISKQSGVKL